MIVFFIHFSLDLSKGPMVRDSIEYDKTQMISGLLADILSAGFSVVFDMK